MCDNLRGFPVPRVAREATQVANAVLQLRDATPLFVKARYLTMARRDYEVIQQCTCELRAMLEVDLFVGAAISVGLISRNEAQGTLKALKTSQMTAVLYILQLLEKKRKCLDLFLSALRKSVEGYLDQQHSHFQLITVLVKKNEEMQVLHCEGTTRAIVTDTCHTCLPSPCMPDCTVVPPSLPHID